MAVALRIEGVNIPMNKHISIGLTAIFGIGRPLALRICKELGIDPETKGSEITPDQEKALRAVISKIETGGDKRRTIIAANQRLMAIKCYRGLRARQKLPRRGQNTRNNSRTVKRMSATGRASSEEQS
ncbi:MAG: 30S ribosomal protein S13 [Gammaproteobacteria bacterium]|jgi:small subunit ribosomal protein S13